MGNTLMLLARLYDATSQELEKALASQTITFNDPRIKEKVTYLGDIAKTISLVYQIETLRSKKDSSAIQLPKEQPIEDPAVKKANAIQKQFQQGASNQNLDAFGGGWKPF